MSISGLTQKKNFFWTHISYYLTLELFMKANSGRLYNINKKVHQLC